MEIILKLNKKQFKELLLDVMVGIFVRGGVAEAMGEDFKKLDELEDWLLSQAKEAGFANLTQNFRGHLLPNDELCDAEEAIMEIYDDDEFWHQIVTRLGKRDFERHKTEEDKKYIKEHNDRLPERIFQFYNKYEKEFEKHGIERLEIKDDK